jgi:hypothetical protein
MKKYALFALVLISTAMSCKKSNSGSGYHMTANIGGTNKSFDQTPPIAARQTSPGPTNVVTVTGILNSSTGESMILTIFSSKDIVAGTYTDSNADFDVSVVYIASLVNQYYTGTSMATEAESQSITIKNHFKLVISSIDARSVKGTFSGDMFDDGNVTTTPKPLTSGDFYAAFAN